MKIQYGEIWVCRGAISLGTIRNTGAFLFFCFFLVFELIYISQAVGASQKISLLGS